MGDVRSSGALGSRPTQPGAGLPPVQADQSSLERETTFPMIGLSSLVEATGSGGTVGAGGAVTGSVTGVGDAISERMEERAWKVLEGD